MILYDICLRNQSATTHSRSTRSTGNRKEATPLPKVDPPDESSRSSTEKPQLQRCFVSLLRNAITSLSHAWNLEYLEHRTFEGTDCRFSARMPVDKACRKA